MWSSSRTSGIWSTRIPSMMTTSAGSTCWVCPDRWCRVKSYIGTCTAFMLCKMAEYRFALPSTSLFSKRKIAFITTQCRAPKTISGYGQSSKRCSTCVFWIGRRGYLCTVRGFETDLQSFQASHNCLAVKSVWRVEIVSCAEAGFSSSCQRCCSHQLVEFKSEHRYKAPSTHTEHSPFLHLLGRDRSCPG